MKSVPIFVLLIALFTPFAQQASAAPAPEVQEISNLMKQGHLDAALDRANAYIAKNPQDAQTRFMKGLILTEQNKSAEAIKTFTALTKDFPGLPEPYNNLAVLYAAQGKYDEAKNALQMAIRTNPSYATAQENLGDIYAKMATAAYDKALQLDTHNTSAQTKLSMIRELFSNNGKPVLMAKAGDDKKQNTVIDTPASKLISVPKPVAQPPAKTKTTPKSIEKEQVETPKEKNPNITVVTEAVEAWAKAWSKRDIDAYLASYSPKFKPSGNESHAAWKKSRRERVTAPKKIVVELTNLQVKELGPKHYQASFRQIYRSDTLSSRTHKVLELVQSGHNWLIIEERNR
ncbi:MAG: tetratricopeptide repeat protein [Sulfuriferula sp.]